MFGKKAMEIRKLRKEVYDIENTINERLRYIEKFMDGVIDERDKEKRKTILIKYHTPWIDDIAQVKGSDWIDLYTAEEVELCAGEYKLIDLGISMMLPKGYEALVIPRSSTFKKYGILLANSTGLIDESYKGDNDIWKFPAYATRNVTIPENVRICQFRILPHQPKINFIPVCTLGNEDRGGIGSTGD